jgi:hypothetical protein
LLARLATNAALAGVLVLLMWLLLLLLLLPLTRQKTSATRDLSATSTHGLALFFAVPFFMPVVGLVLASLEQHRVESLQRLLWHRLQGPERKTSSADTWQQHADLFLLSFGRGCNNREVIFRFDKVDAQDKKNLLAKICRPIARSEWARFATLSNTAHVKVH